MVKGLLARMEERLASFLLVQIRESLGKMSDEMGQLLRT
jgi:hypothetical protein